VAAAAQKLGAAVIVYDPEAMGNAKRAYPQLAMASSALEAARNADVLLLLTEWSEFREMDPAKLASVVAGPRIVDGRNALDPTTWRDAGWTYRALGRP
jgi:UDPglucose 6-dehydrogenase